MNVNNAPRFAQDAEPAKINGLFGYCKSRQDRKSRPCAPQLLEQPPPAVNYGEANGKANQDYNWASEKEFLYHSKHLALT